MIKSPITKKIIWLYLCSCCCVSCQQNTSFNGEQVDSDIVAIADSLQNENDRLKKQIRLYQDTMLEQKIRLDRIKTILEPLIEQKHE